MPTRACERDKHVQATLLLLFSGPEQDRESEISVDKSPDPD
jgi:hypothetical protein